MNASLFVEVLINGICQGSIYALFAIGYALIVGIVGMVSFTHGEVIMIGAFTAYFFANVSGNIFLNIIVCFISTGILGIIIYHVCYHRFLEAPRHISLICTIGMSTLLQNLVQVYVTTATVGMPKLIPSGHIEIGNVMIQYYQIWVMVIVILLCVVLSYFMNNTKLGCQLRAVSQDRTASALVGIPVNRITMLGNVIGCGIGGVGGLLYGIYYSSLSATMGGNAALKTFCACVVGGLSNIVTSAASGLAIGIFENFGVTLTTSSMRNIVAFVFVIAVLLVKPEGFASKGGKK